MKVTVLMKARQVSLALSDSESQKQLQSTSVVFNSSTHHSTYRKLKEKKGERMQYLCNAVHGCPALLSSCCYAYLEVLNELFKAGHMSSCLHSCSSFFVSCCLLLGQLPVKHLLQPLLQVALLRQLPPPHLHPLCMCLNHKNGDCEP